MTRYIKLSKLAKISNINRKTLQRWCREGKIPGATKLFGSHWWIDTTKLIRDEEFRYLFMELLEKGNE